MQATYCPPPNRFQAAVGVTSAKLIAKQPPFIKRSRTRGRFAVGVRYEDEVQQHLELAVLSRPGVLLHKSQWLEFWSKSGKRWCQIDAFVVKPEERIGIIYEIKYQHTSDAWWQLRHLYEPVLSAAMPGIHWGLMEVVHWFDSATAFPERPVLTDSLLKVPRGNSVAVHILNPKRPARLQSAGPADREDVRA